MFLVVWAQVLFLDGKDRLQQRLREHELDTECLVNLTPRQFVMPGLVDCHIHSPQLAITALGTDKGLLDWLTTYTYPAEARFADHDFAHQAHHKTVRRTLRGGTTLASYYSTIHTDTTLLLCQAADELGQRALVGKVNMDLIAPEFYRETTQQSVAETERFLDEVLSYKSGLVTPVITPRFAPSCTLPLMTKLGEIAKERNIPIQTHLSETVEEIETVMKLHPGHQSYTEVYDAAGLLGPKTILGHCIHLSDKEIDTLKSRDCGLVHCACSNNTLRSGVMDIRRLMDRGLKLGLGTDMAGGYTTSMLASIRHSVDVSNMCAIHSHNKQRQNGEHQQASNHTTDGSPPYRPLTMAEAFRLATLDGSSVLGQNCGNFEPGREFDGLLIDPEVKDSPLDLFDFDTPDDVVQKFLYTGDDRNISKVYVQGREVVSRTE
ncbi:hypothetical protein V1264_010668 [Littorina saxatilis]|uniref:Guanine deaminase n=1 Tax=Littorina saxatilis TaxID=31220 RepID=A0AAN9G0K6_9CAEN